MKVILDFFSDKKLLMGVGIGMILSCILMFGYEYKSNVSNEKIEEAARGLGMHYSDECKVIFKGDEKND